MPTEFVAAITNPLQFATKALEQLAIGTGENEEEVGVPLFDIHRHTWGETEPSLNCIM